MLFFLLQYWSDSVTQILLYGEVKSNLACIFVHFAAWWESELLIDQFEQNFIYFLKKKSHEFDDEISQEV